MFNVSTAYQTAIKQSSRTIKSSIGFGNKSLTNAITNGDFSASTSGWVTSNSTISSDGIQATMLASAVNGNMSATLPITTNNKYYMMAIVKATSSLVSINIGGGIGGFAFHSGSGNYETLSAVITSNTTATSSFRITDARTSAWANINVKQCLVFDLTTLFGVGNEPSKVYLDELMSKVGWFNASRNVPLQFVDDRILINRVLNGNFNGTTNWTQASCTATVTSNVATVTMTSQFGEYRQINTPFYVAGHQYYSRAEVQANSNQVSLRVSRASGSAQLVASHSGSGAYETLSGIQILNSPVTNGFTSIMDIRASGWTAILVKNVVTLDLTAIYGAGNEPTKAYMDTLVNAIGWFNSASLSPTTTGEQTIIQDFNIENSFGSNNLPTIGGVFSNKLSASFIKESRLPQVLIGIPIRPYTAIDIGSGVFEWVRHGEFYADYSDVTKTERIVKLESYDSMASYDSMIFDTSASVTYPAKLETIIADLNANSTVQFQPRTLYGRNICVTQFQDWETGEYNTVGVKAVNPARIRLGGGLIAVTPNTTYYVSTFDATPKVCQLIFRAYDLAGTTFVRNIGAIADGGTFTTGATEYWLSATLWETTDTADFTFWQSSFDLNQVKPFLCLNSEPDKSFDIFLPHIRFDTKPTVTMRQALGLMASQMAHNCTINDIGLVDFRFLNSSGFGFDASNYITFKLLSDAVINIDQLIVPHDPNPYLAGTGVNFAISFDNDQIQSGSELLQIYDISFPLNYYAYTMKAQGMPHLQIGDTVQFTDKIGVVRTLAIVNHKFVFNGGMTSEFTVDAPKKETTIITPTGGSTMVGAIAKVSETLTQAFTDANQLITGNQGGFIVTRLDPITGQPTDLVICDTGDLSTAQNLWRWNQQGLIFTTGGFANSNPNDTNVAITSKGEIDARFIKVGVLNADLIKTGKIQDQTGASWIDMTNGTFSFGGGKLSWNGTLFEINYDNSTLGDALDSKVNTSDIDVNGVKTYFQFGTDNLLIGKTTSPQEVQIDNTSLQFIDTGNGIDLTVTALSGTGSVITVDFTNPNGTNPFIPTSYIQIKDCSTVGYNGHWKVLTAPTSTRVTATCVATGSPATLGKVTYGFHANDKAVAWINSQKMFITDVELKNSIVIGKHKMATDTATGYTLISYIG